MSDDSRERARDAVAGADDDARGAVADVAAGAGSAVEDARRAVEDVRGRLSGVDGPDDDDAVRGALATAALAFDAVLYAAGRYAPEYLRLLETSPVGIGAFGTVGVALVLAATYVPMRRFPEWLGALAGAVGLGTWAVAGLLGGVYGVPVAGWFVVGLAPICAWLAYAPPSSRTGPEASPFTRHVDGRTDASAGPAIASAGPAIAAVAFATVLLFAGTALAALRTVMLLGAALGVAAAVAAVVTERTEARREPGSDASTADGDAPELPSDPDDPGADRNAGPVELDLERPRTGRDGDAAGSTGPSRDRSTERPADRSTEPSRDRSTELPADRSTTPPDDPGLEPNVEPPSSPVEAARRLPPAARGLVLADALVGVALAVVSGFVVVTVTSRVAPSTGALGLDLGPGVAFGVLLALELAVGAGARHLGAGIADRIGSTPLVGWAFALSAAFPLLLVALPADLVVLAVLFAAFGTRFVAVEPRRRLLAAAVGGDGSHLPRPIRLLRDVPTALAPLAGGVLYAVSPVLAFGAATTVGALGAWELVRYACR